MGECTCAISYMNSVDSFQKPSRALVLKQISDRYSALETARTRLCYIHESRVSKMLFVISALLPLVYMVLKLYQYISLIA